MKIRLGGLFDIEKCSMLVRLGTNLSRNFMLSRRISMGLAIYLESLPEPEHVCCRILDIDQDV